MIGQATKSPSSRSRRRRRAPFVRSQPLQQLPGAGRFSLARFTAGHQAIKPVVICLVRYSRPATPQLSIRARRSEGGPLPASILLATVLVRQ